MSELYSNGFVNLDGGFCLGFFFDDSDYFVSIDVRKFDSYRPEWTKNHYKEPQEINRKSDICVRYLSDKLRVDLDRRRKESRDITDLKDEERVKIYAEAEKAITRLFESRKPQGEIIAS